MHGMTKKMGPLPVWAWGLIIGVGAYFVYARMKGGSATTTAAGATGSVDPSAIDPNTGLTYGQEESAASGASATQGAEGSLGSSGGSTNVGGGPTPISGELTDLESLFGLIQMVDPNFSPTAGQPAAAADTPAATTGVVSTPPTTHAKIAAPKLSAKIISKDLLTSSGIGPNEGSAAYIAKLIQEGYKYGKGKAAGTLTKAGSATKYYVFEAGGQKHIRMAAPPKPAAQPLVNVPHKPAPTKIKNKG